MHKIAILTYNHASLFELSCAVELFALPRPEFHNWYQADVISFDGRPIQTTGDIQLITKQVSSLDAYDTVVIPSWPVNVTKIKGQLPDELLRFVANGNRILSFCSGSFLLAQLGILDKQDATTHWRYAEKFKQRFPKVSYVDDVLYVYQGLIGCSAGSAAALDLGLEVIRSDFGPDIANQVARRLLLSAHRKGGQAQFADTTFPALGNEFSEVMQWARNNLHQPLSIDELAARCHMSRRTFDRKFRAKFETTPMEWLITQRVDAAKQRLQAAPSNTNNRIDQIAYSCGFNNATTMRHHFRKKLGVSPRQYRDQFAIDGKLSNK